jgi:beta-glucosidase
MILGDYPPEMHEILGPNLPEFTIKQRKKLRETKLDFIGLNHYSTYYVKDCIFSSCALDPIDGDALAVSSVERDGVLIGKEVIIRLVTTNSC